MAYYKGKKLIAGAGITPTINSSKNWVIGGTDTGVRASGDTVTVGSDGYVYINGVKTSHKIVSSYSDLTDKPGLSTANVVTYQGTVTNKQVRNITVSTSEPTASDGVNGDIWIVYE